MRADRAGTDVTGCSRTSTGRMISEPLQLDILTIEQQHRRNTERKTSAFPVQDQAAGTEITAEKEE